MITGKLDIICLNMTLFGIRQSLNSHPHKLAIVSMHLVCNFVQLCNVFCYDWSAIGHSSVVFSVWMMFVWAEKYTKSTVKRQKYHLWNANNIDCNWATVANGLIVGEVRTQVFGTEVNRMIHSRNEFYTAYNINWTVVLSVTVLYKLYKEPQMKEAEVGRSITFSFCAECHSASESD